MKKLLIAACALTLFACHKSSTTAPVVLSNSNNGVAPGVYTNLFNFTSNTGKSPDGSLIISGNTLYGMTTLGGAYGKGNIFSIDVNGNGYTDLHDFGSIANDGSQPIFSLTLYNGVLYGCTTSGGEYSYGVIFSLNTDGSGYQLLHDYGPSEIYGQSPYCTLVISNGVMYGTTILGGSSDNGTIFSMNCNGTDYTTLYNFGTPPNGSEPEGVIALSGNTLYGVAEAGGTNSYGLIFSINTDGSGYNTLYNFTSSGGYECLGLLVQGNTLYGMNFMGGPDSAGSIFSIPTSGSSYSDIYNFNKSAGGKPAGALALYNGTLYGLASAGGSNSEGVIFSIGTDGSGYKDLYNFNGTNGETPYGTLVISSGIAYGMTNEGGTGNYGVIFSFSL